MFKEFLNNNWFFIGIGFVVIFGIGCYLWFQNDLANFRQHYASISQLSKSKETRKAGSLQTEQSDKPQPEAQSVKNSPAPKNTTDGTHSVTSTIEENSENVTDTTLEGTIEETVSTEEEAAENLSPEELREQELKKRLKDISAQMKVLIEKAGGKVDASSDPEVRREMQQLTTEMFQIMQEGVKEEDQPAFNFFMNLMTIGNNSVNSKGELIVSEYVKMADLMESAGMGEIAKGMRALAQIAIDSGSDVIKPEHINKALR